MKRLLLLTLIGLLMLGALHAQSTVPNVWSVPATKNWFVSTTSNVRGMAFNPVTNRVYVPSRDAGINKVIILNAATGDSVGTLNMTGISGGTFAFNRIAVTSDGRIYTTNLVTTVSKAAPFKIYTWADESSAPVLVFNDSIRGPRLGDALAVAGSGQNTFLYASGNASPGPVHIFKRSGDTLVYYKDIAPNTWGAFGVLGFGPTVNGFGDFWINTAGRIAMKFDTTGAAVDSISGTIVAGGASTAHYFEFGGRKFVGMYSGNTTPSVFRFADVTAGGVNAYVAGITASLGSTSNTNGTGEIFFSAADTSLYAIATNNSVGKFSITQAMPVVSYNSRSPFVPKAAENDTVFVNILSMKPLSDAKLAYYGKKTSVSDQTGDDSARVTMDQFNGRIYRGVVPASVNRDGRRVNFMAEVTDNVGNKNVPAHLSGYYAGVTKLAYTGGPREVDTNGVLLFKGYGIRSRGVVTVEDSIFQVANNEVVVQDDMGGVTVFVAPIAFDVVRGNMYTVTGTTDNPTGGGSKFQFVNPGVSFTDEGPAVVPVAPKVVTIKQILQNGELFENSLVKVRGVSKTPGSAAWPALGASVNMTFTDASGDSITMRIDGDTNIDGMPEPKYPITIVGVSGQFDNTSPFTSGYQWLPRDVNDIIPELKIGLRDTTHAIVGTEFVLPVLAGNVTGTGITAYQFTVQFDTTALQFINANTVGSLSAGYTLAVNLVKNGTVNVAGSGTQPLKDSGAIFNYRFKVLKTGGSTVALTGKLNEGNPDAMIVGGVVVGGVAMESEPNDSMAVANPVALGMEINGTLSKTTGDPDYYEINATAGHLVVDVTDAANTTDADIYLYDGTGKLMYNVDRNSNDRLEFKLTAAGKYYIKVQGYLDAGTYATGPYKMLARMGTPTDANEPNDGPLFGIMNVVTPKTFDFTDTTNTLDPGVGIPGNDYDYFSIIATPGQTITAVVQSKSFKSTSTLNNVQVRIYRKGTFPTAIVTQSTTSGADVTATHSVAVADTYYVRVVNTVGAEAGPAARYKLTVAKPTGVIDHLNGVPMIFALEQNYPNPFNPTTVIRFALPQASSTKIVIYDMLGREVRSLVNSELNAGFYESTWDGKNNMGASVATGVYIYRIEAGTFVSTKKMMLMK